MEPACHKIPGLAGPPLTLCAFHRREQVNPESGEAVENVVLPGTLVSMTGLVGLAWDCVLLCFDPPDAARFNVRLSRSLIML